MRYSIAIVSTILGLSLAGCERSADKPGDASKPPAAEPPQSNDNHEQNPPVSHTSADTKDDSGRGAQAGHGGEIIELGTNKAGTFSVRASRDRVEFKAGGDAPIDVWIDGSTGTGVAVVRFWIGTQDAKGSMRAKAEIEDGKWHTHVEIPLPMPAESKLWVEIEVSTGEKTEASFDLRV